MMTPISDEYITHYQEQARPLEQHLATCQAAFLASASRYSHDKMTEARDELSHVQHDLFASFCDELIERYADEDFPTALVDYLYSGDHDFSDPSSWRQIEKRASLFATPSGIAISPSP